MKKRKKTFHAPGSPKALSLQRFKYGWDTNPESMELRRKRAVEKRSRTCRIDRENIYKYFVFQQSFNEISPEILEHICYQIRNGKSGRGKFTKIKSVRRYLTKHRFIEYDFKRDLYLNCYKIAHEEKERAETDRRKAEDEQRRVEREAQQAEDERLRAQRLEADRVQRATQQGEAQQRHREPEPQQAVAKPPQAHRETQAQPISQSGLTELERLKQMRERTLMVLKNTKERAEKNTNRDYIEGFEQTIAVLNERLVRTDLQISELENCEAKCS
jgi:hypothetical protein